MKKNKKREKLVLGANMCRVYLHVTKAGEEKVADNFYYRGPAEGWHRS